MTPSLPASKATRIEQGIEIRPAVTERTGPKIWILHKKTKSLEQCYEFLYAGWTKDDAISYAQGYQRRNRSFDYDFMIKEFNMPRLREVSKDA